MPRAYLRVPFYVGCYLRSRRDGEVVKECQPVNVSGIPNCPDILRYGIRWSENGHVGQARAFSQSAWKRMLQGNSVDKKVKKPLRKPVTNEILRDEDICLLSGLRMKDVGGGEWICVDLPHEVMVNGRVNHVTPQHTLTADAVNRMRYELVRDFKYKFLKYLCRDFEVNAIHLLKHIATRRMTEVLDAFMLRYEIPDSPGHPERQQLKRYLYRWCKEDVTCVEDEIEHLVESTEE